MNIVIATLASAAWEFSLSEVKINKDINTILLNVGKLEWS